MAIPLLGCGHSLNRVSNNDKYWISKSPIGGSLKQLKIFIDTSVFSAYHDGRNPDRRDFTRDFWNGSVGHERYVSRLVLEEIGQIQDRFRRDCIIQLTGACKILELDDEIISLSEMYIKENIIPEKHVNDAIHLATATRCEMDILVSWNFKHLVKRKTRLMVKYFNAMNDYHTIEIIAPPEL